MRRSSFSVLSTRICSRSTWFLELFSKRGFTSNMSQKEKQLSVVFVYSKDFMERVIRNVINDPSYCKSCGLYCESCKYNVYSYVRNVRAAIQLPKPADLPAFVDNPEEYMPKKLPKADICL